jgi:1-acyl-sn-glycerol-3-phosphate acyltransferase/CRP-like cAMP-binding protein
LDYQIMADGTQHKDDVLDRLARSPFWNGLEPARLIPLLESAGLRTVASGEMLFQQFHPAKELFLLQQGTAMLSTASASRTEMVHYGTIDWPDAALGWSGFVPPQRYGSTVTARTDLKLLAWPHELLASLFYRDPELAVRFFRLVLGSVQRHFAGLRRERVAAASVLVAPPLPDERTVRRPVVGRADNCFRRSAFFSSFEEEVVDELAGAAVLESWQPGERIVRQDESVDGLLLLAGGRCNVFFEQEGTDERLLPFRRVHRRNGLIAGVPDAAGGFVAEAGVFAESHCWVYRLPADAIQTMVAADPEFGRAFQQRLLARLAGLIGAVQVERDDRHDDPEANVVANTVAGARARLPVTSDLYKVPHLLRHRLTIGNAFAVLRKVAETGRYHERILAGRCNDLIGDLAAENAFYHEILAAVEQVISSDETAKPSYVRKTCDKAVDRAFSFLDCRVIGEEKLPSSSGNVFILNHLACPEYYELPNHYHFSFDTAFVSCIVWRKYGQSAIRVVRESPDAEFGHNLFYRRLGHVTVPTIESGLNDVDDEAFAALRREASEAFTRDGKAALAEGLNLIICPEGQSQPAELSPARFHTGAFRLAIDAGRRIVPIALAGFHRRFKDGPLVAIIGDPIDVAHAMRKRGSATVREFADAFREEFAVDVAKAAEIAAQPANLCHPD